MSRDAEVKIEGQESEKFNDQEVRDKDQAQSLNQEILSHKTRTLTGGLIAVKIS